MGERKGLCSLFSTSHANDDEEELKEHIVSDITQLVGWTPLIELKRIVEKDGVDARLVGKIESYQPLSSVKDRSALRMIEDAEQKGLIKPGITTLVEPTSGNLGIGLAYIAARKGYRFIAVMPATCSIDKRMLLLYLGAEVLITDMKLGIQGVFDKVEELKKNGPDVHVLDQFSNPANPEAHFFGTGPEIWKDTAGKVDILVCGAGSGGTVSGAGKYLKMKNPNLKVVCVEPAESAVLSGGEPGPHNIQGIGPGIVPKNLDRSYVDEVITVTTKEAMTYARRIAREEGLLVGISSGANLAACIKVARRVENKGKLIVTVFPSGGERYLSTELFDDVREECMNMSF
ncbi:bifunctional cystathionine gamma-lyase/cysteine synthase-like [Iris pallida]|uniref:Bifunctional cystathionine gamma-lyase/cysteine synthase-like n=1 Tax=Iris pallida TaxID=29817 RepID=A0AAX6IM25_IRIPA|nr:bifunctional cystathionine gamma-lyase/cysteine synthase-like [Iris pallida]KAJ6853834.1 bifunctional cystathionine gamma-lyase/cysteine synthase-like [Iris pallida]